MRNFYLLSIFCLIALGNATAQQTATVSFLQTQDTIRKKAVSVIYPIIIKTDSVKIDQDSLKFYTVTAKVDAEKSTLPKSDYKLDYSSITMDKLSSEQTFFLTIKGDSITDRDRHLFLNLEITKGGVKEGINVSSGKTTMHIIVEGVRDITKYNYLGYIGTNFDLIDGVRAKDIFFAVNLFAPPQDRGKGFGFNLTLYGNRTLSLTDTSGRRQYTSRIVGIGGDSARTYTEEALRTVTRVSDNLGATFSPLIRIGKVSDPGRKTQLYYAPQFEFIWRRTKITTSYTDNVLVDSTDRPNRPIRGTLILTPATETIPINIYDVYLGLAGATLNHENEHISVRIQASLGINYSYIALRSSRLSEKERGPEYDRSWNVFTYLRTWITEPISGLTFGGEVSNLFGKGNYRPYYNVTLSKAINLNALGAIFQPITAR